MEQSKTIEVDFYIDEHVRIKNYGIEGFINCIVQQRNHCIKYEIEWVSNKTIHTRCFYAKELELIK